MPKRPKSVPVLHDGHDLVTQDVILSDPWIPDGLGNLLVESYFEVTIGSLLPSSSGPGYLKGLTVNRA